MKFLVFNSNVDAERKISSLLKQAGISALINPRLEEAWQALLLHGSSVDFAIIHIEGAGGKGQPGLELAQRIKNDPSQSDLPFILTTEKWSDAECMKHQASGPAAANGYLKTPIQDAELKMMVEAILGVSVFPENTRTGMTKTGATKTGVTKTGVTKTGATKAGLTKTGATKTGATKTGAVKAPPPAKAAGAGAPPPLPKKPAKSASAEQARSVPVAAMPIEMKPIEMSSVPPPVGQTESSQLIEGSSGRVVSSSIQLQSLDDFSKAFGSTSPESQAVSSSSAPTRVTLRKPDENADKTKGIRIDSSEQGFAENMLEKSRQPGDAEDAPAPPVTPEFIESSKSVPALESAPSMVSAITKTPMAPDLPATGELMKAHAEVNSPLPLEISSPSVDLKPFSIEQQVTNPVSAEQPKTVESEIAAPDDQEAVQQMPYLFGQSQQGPGRHEALAAFAQPVGDAVVPGGAAHTPDLDTLKKYLLLREQDVSALSAQLKSSKEQIGSLEDQVKVEKAKSAELQHMVNQQKAQIGRYDQDKSQIVQSLQSEINELKFQVRVKTDKALSLENQVNAAAEEIENIKKRVRMDIRKIRMREKELENKLEILKKDSEALIGSRENKIIELKRKLDLLEFNMDLLQDQYTKEKASNGDLKARLAKAAQAMRIAGGLLDTLPPAASEPSDQKADSAAKPKKAS
jgi:hypothetical protein